MSRRKLWNNAWTVVLIVSLVCQFALGRPSVDAEQDATNTTKNLLNNITKPSESPIRYTHRNFRDSLNISNISNLEINDLINFYNKINKSKRRTSNARTFRINNRSKILSKLSSIDVISVQSNPLFEDGMKIEPFMSDIRNEDRSKARMKSLRKYQNSKSVISKPENKRSKPVIKWTKRVSNNKTDPNNNEIKSNEEVENTDGKPIIRKVYTKWTDKTKLDDIQFTKHSNTLSSDVNRDAIAFGSTVGDYSTEKIYEDSSTEVAHVSTSSQIENKLVRPTLPYSEEAHVYSSNIHVMDFNNRRPIKFNRPSPTPIITHLGTPKPWLQPEESHSVTSNSIKRPSVIKPVKINRPSNIFNLNNNEKYTTPYPYPQYPYRPELFDVTTSEPVHSYTDKIIIRPEEYNASSEDCPTIYLTLNNTFQEAQGKEACPDLNIAVNTNVVNKHVIIEESEEEEPDYMNGPFGLPIEEESESVETPNADFDASNENSESDEPETSQDYDQLEAYNAAPVEEFDSSGSSIGGGGAYSGGGGSAYQALMRPGRKPNKHKDKDDDYGLGSLNSWVKPVMNIMSWFAALNPFNFGIFSLMLTPLAIMMAGTSGVAALFAPWALPYARQSPKIVHVYRPQWHWNDEEHAWSYNSFPNNRVLRFRESRLDYSNFQNDKKPKISLASQIKSWLFQNFASSIKSLTTNLRGMQRLQKSKRKKRFSGNQPIK